MLIWPCQQPLKQKQVSTSYFLVSYKACDGAYDHMPMPAATQARHVKVTKSAIPSFNNKMTLPCQQPLKQGQGKVMNDDEACDHLLYQQPLKQSKYCVVT